MQRHIVLLVEDEEDDRFLLRLAVKRSGLPIEIKEVHDGREAIRYLAGEPPYADRDKHPLPCLLLLDLHMPIMTGFDVLSWQKRRPEEVQIPVVVLTSSTHDADRKRSLRLGAVAFHKKPSTPSASVALVKELYEAWLEDRRSPTS